MASFFQRVLFALLATSISISQAFGTALQQRDSKVIAPLSITPDQNWDGIDGKWSSFTLRVGTPQQFVRTFVSFAVYQTWVVLPLGCVAAEDQSACADARGWLFDNDTSSTFDYIGVYDLWVGRNLGATPNAAAGFDRVGLGGVGEGGPTLENTTIAAFASQKMYYMGIFGINPKPTNYSDFNDPSTSYMTQLKEQKMIPSVSFGYTAGAYYRFTGSFASLTLGGYDTSKYEANNLTFIFAPDNERDVMVAIQSISTPARIASNPVATELLPSKVYALIDSTSAELWLPLDACKIFEYEFGLTYDNDTDLYLVNDTLHDSLLERNASVTFKLGQSPDSEETVKITLPYAAFDQKVTPPYRNVANISNYFPLRRGANDTQYTLGRTFLQEAYITVDYEVSRFQLSQVVWDQTAEKNIVAIPPANAAADDSLWTSPNWSPTSATGGTSGTGGRNGLTSSGSDSDDSSLGAGAIAGIAVGAAAVIALIGTFVFFYLRRQKRKKAAAAAAVAAAAASHESKPSSSDGSTTSQVNSATVYPKAELAGSGPLPFGMTHHERDLKGLLPPGMSHTPNGSVSATSPMSSSAGEGTFSSGNTLLSPASEADSRPVEIYEMPGDMPLVREKDGKQLSEKEALQHREKLYNGVDSTVTTPTTAGGADAILGGAQDSAYHTPPRRVNPEDIVNAHTGQSVSGHHRAFSFEGERGTHDSR
jgi:hypothetical protein